MKTATHFLGALFACLIFSNLSACPPRAIGEIKVIDQFGAPIAGSKVFRFTSATDSIPLRYGYNYYDDAWETDSSKFLVYRYYNDFWLEENEEAAEYYYRITAPGYADVLIKSASFEDTREYWHRPILEVVLYAKQLVKTNQSYYMHDVFLVDHEVEVVDSLRLDKKLFFEEIQKSTGEELGNVTVRAYPNPVVNELHIEFSKTQLASNRFVLHDATGKLVHEQTSDASKFDLLMNWYAPGTYFLTIYDSSNSPILRQKLVHQ